MRRPDALDERAKHLRSTLHAAYGNVVTSPLPSDIVDLLRAMEGGEAAPLGSV
jgi:hypothetical protein